MHCRIAVQRGNKTPGDLHPIFITDYLLELAVDGAATEIGRLTFANRAIVRSDSLRARTRTCYLLMIMIWRWPAIAIALRPSVCDYKCESLGCHYVRFISFLVVPDSCL